MISERETDLAVVVVEDDRGTRQGLAALLDGTPGFACVGTYHSVEQARLRAPARDPDVVLLDIDLPGRPGSEGVGLLREDYPGATIVMLTVFDDDAKIFESLCRGARGYLLKSTPPARILEAVRVAAGGGVPISPGAADKVLRLFRELEPPKHLDCDLSERQVRLLELLADGHSYRSAAEALDISINTVRKHVRLVYDKLQVHSKSEAVSKAIRAGII